MPYIAPELRALAATLPTTPGELNFAITRLLVDYLDRSGLSYTALSECVVACECAKLEFVRRVVVPYEESKRLAHGDVY